MSEAWDDYEETDECWECGGDGGWNSCMADCCPAVGGEEGCTDRHCWRTCPNCRGGGFLPVQSGSASADIDAEGGNTSGETRAASNLPNPNHSRNTGRG